MKEEEEQVNKISLTLIIDEPDIILVETLKDMNASSIIFNVSITLFFNFYFLLNFKLNFKTKQKLF